MEEKRKRFFGELYHCALIYCHPANHATAWELGEGQNNHFTCTVEPPIMDKLGTRILSIVQRLSLLWR